MQAWVERSESDITIKVDSKPSSLEANLTLNTFGVPFADIRENKPKFDGTKPTFRR